jgi:hypothetical protein
MSPDIRTCVFAIILTCSFTTKIYSEVTEPDSPDVSIPNSLQKLGQFAKIKPLLAPVGKQPLDQRVLSRCFL